VRKKAGAVIVAAGRGRRFASKTPKQFASLLGRPLVWWSLAAFERAPEIGAVALVVSPQRIPQVEAWLREWGFKKSIRLVAGGRERVDSVRQGVLSLVQDFDPLLIHDGARPLVSPSLISRVLRATLRYGAALAALPLTDTLKYSKDQKFVQGTVDRSGFYLAQTPQGLRASLLRRWISKRSPPLTDDVQWAERLHHPVCLVKGEGTNVKVTLPEDLVLCERLLRNGPPLS